MKNVSYLESSGTPRDAEMYKFDFENNFSSSVAVKNVEVYTPLALAAVGAYVIFVFAGPECMKNRPRLELRLPLILWNVALAAFSILGSVRTIQESIRVADKGVHHLLCNNYYFQEPVIGFWCYAFVLSKLVEFGDTVFIVLRKQPLIFLHWYHHITVMLYCWFGYLEFSSTGRAFGTMNFTVHSFMYTYYALKAMRVRMPNSFALIVTTIQLSQMVIGVAIVALAYSMKNSAYSCSVLDTNLKAATCMYLSYFVLFANFFYRTYVKKGGKRSINIPEKTEQVLSQAQVIAKKAL